MAGSGAGSTTVTWKGKSMEPEQNVSQTDDEATSVEVDPEELVFDVDYAVVFGADPRSHLRERRTGLGNDAGWREKRFVSLRKDGAGDGNRTRDQQLGRL